MRKSKGRKAREAKGLLNYISGTITSPEDGFRVEVIEDFMEKVFAPTRQAARNLVKDLILWEDDKEIDKGTADYFIEKYTGTEFDGVPLYFTRGDQAFICTIGFLRELKIANKNSILYSTEPL